MNKEELVETLKEHFYTKSEMDEHFVTKSDLGEQFATKGELFAGLTEIRNELEKVNDKLDEHSASVMAVDGLLEAHPIERITRLEQHAHLPKYIHTNDEE